MSDLTRKFFEAAKRTEMFTSHAEELNRYSKPPKKGMEAYKRWLLLDLASRWEWLPRFKWMQKNSED